MQRETSLKFHLNNKTAKRHILKLLYYTNSSVYCLRLTKLRSPSTLFVRFTFYTKFCFVFFLCQLSHRKQFFLLEFLKESSSFRLFHEFSENFFNHFTASLRYLYHLLRSLRDLFTISYDLLTMSLRSFPMSLRCLYDRVTIFRISIRSFPDVFTIYLQSFIDVFAIDLQSPHHLSVRFLYNLFSMSLRCLYDCVTVSLQCINILLTISLQSF